MINNNNGGGGGGRVSIPINLKKTIHNIKEIAGSHSDEDVFFMLQECNMDPDETAHKLFLLDAFHEVKKKRNRKKENINKEPADPRLKSGVRGQGNRGSCPLSHDAGGGCRNSTSGKENETCQVPEDGVGISTRRTTFHDTKNKGTSVTSPSAVIVDSSAGTASESKSVGPDGCQFPEGGNNQFVKEAANIAKLDGALPLKSMAEASKTPTDAFEIGDAREKLLPSSSSIPTCRTSTPSPGAHFSASDPVLVPSQDPRLLSAVGIIKHEVGSQKIPSEQIQVVPDDRKLIGVSSEVGSSILQGKIPNKPLVVGKNQVSESSQPATSIQGSPSVGRHSPNYSRKSPHVINLQKGPNKEWKPKPSNPIFAQQPGTGVSLEIPAVQPKAKSNLHPAANVLDARQSTSELEKKLEESQIYDIRHVIIPSHLHVPEVEKLGFCFGSFDANFTLNSSRSCPENDKRPSFSETSEVVKERVEEQPSTLNVLVTSEEGDFSDCPPSTSHVPEVLVSGEGDVSSTVALEYTEPKQETDLAPEGHPYSFVHTSPNYSFGIMPPMAGNPVPPSESSDAQGRDVSRLPSFVVQQSFDPASYYAQFYRSGSDVDGHILPFNSTGFSTKFNGNATNLSPQTSQSEAAGNSLIMSPAGTAPLVTQAPAVMQSSIAVTQQPLPLFRHPAGMHLPHYPTNYVPYGHYFSPFYVHPPTIHQFLSNGAFPPQPQAGSVYPALPATTNKYSLPQYRPAGNAGNSTHVGVPGNYGPYGSSPTGFHLNSATTGNSISTDDLIASQFKENNTFMTGQQTEGSGVWIAAPGREISGLQTSSFYNLPQAQMTYGATQAGHGSFAGMYHPAQPVTAAAIHPLIQQSQSMAGVVDMSGPVSSVYQPSQPAPTNWPNSF